MLISSSIVSCSLLSPYSTEALFFLPTLSFHEDYTDFPAFNGIYVCHKLLRSRFLKFLKTADTIHSACPDFLEVEFTYILGGGRNTCVLIIRKNLLFHGDSDVKEPLHQIHIFQT